MSPPSSTIPPTTAGGFLPPEPDPSSSSSTSSPPSSIAPSVYTPRPLPTPHSRPLRSGSRQESALLNYLDNAILEIGRRFVKKYLPGGYRNVDEVVDEIERVVDLVWVSGTPYLQIQYLLTLSSSFNDYISGFTPRWPKMLQLLGKLDQAFYELIMSGELNMTEKVRIKGVAERTRLHVVKLLELGGSVEEEGEETGEETGEDDDADVMMIEEITAPDPATEGEKTVGDRRDVVGEWERDGDGNGDGEEEEEEDDDEELEILVARVYEQTLGELGDRLGE